MLTVHGMVPGQGLMTEMTLPNEGRGHLGVGERERERDTG